MQHHRYTDSKLTLNGATGSFKGNIGYFETVEFKNNIEVSNARTYYEEGVGSTIPSFVSGNSQSSSTVYKIVPYTTTYDLYFGTRKMNDVNCKDFWSRGFSKGTGKVSYDDTKKTLTINSAYIRYDDYNSDGTPYKYPAFENWAVTDLVIALNGETRIYNRNKEYATMAIDRNTTMEGTIANSSAVINLSNDFDNDLSIGHKNQKNVTLTIKGGITVNAGNIIGVNGGNLTVENANVVLSGKSAGTITGLSDLTLTKCHIAEPAGAVYDTTDKALKVNGSVWTGKVVIKKGVGTGIEEVTAASSIDRTAKAYNLKGQRVGSDYKGLRILDGKKIYTR